MGTPETRIQEPAQGARKQFAALAAPWAVHVKTQTLALNILWERTWSTFSKLTNCDH